MTDIEILKYVIEKIDGITVPLTMMNQVLAPLNESSKLLKALLEKVSGTVQNDVPDDRPVGGTGEDDEEEFV